MIAGEPKEDSLQSTGVVPRAIHDVSIVNNKIHGGFSMRGAEDIHMEGNEFLEKGARIILEQNQRFQSKNNAVAGGDSF